MENENISTEVIDESWDDIVIDDSDIISDEEAKEEAADPANQQENGGENEAPEENGGGSDQSFKLKYLGAEREVNRDEVITYAQKGMDYDRIRTKYNEAQEVLNEVTERLKAFEADGDALEALRQLASEQKMDLSEFVIQSIAAVNASKNGTSVTAELNKTRLDFERKAFEKQKSEWEKGKDTQRNTKNADEEMQAEIDEFAAAFPEIAADAKVIPREVWDAKNASPEKSLTQHYKDYLNAQKDAEIADLKSRLEQAEQNALNKYRSTGAQGSSDLGDLNSDVWERMWEQS